MLLLANCTDEPRLQTGSEKLFRKSLVQISKSISPEKFAAFDQALKEIALARLGVIYHMPGRLLPLARTDVFTTTLVQRIDTDWPKVRESVVRDNIGASVDGRSPDEIIRMVDQEKHGAVERARHHLLSRLAQNRRELSELAARAAELPALELNQDVINAVRISSSGLYFRNTNAGSEPMVSLLVMNKREHPISRMRVVAALEMPEGTLLAKEIHELSFSGGLYPGIEQRIFFVLQVLTDAEKFPREIVARSKLTINPIAVEDVQGGRLGAAEMQRMSKREQELKQLIAELERQLADLMGLRS
jgi:hypothetical protein